VFPGQLMDVYIEDQSTAAKGSSGEAKNP